jgi:hypothetical protein
MRKERFGSARLCWPQDAIPSGDWHMPGIQRITN